MTKRGLLGSAAPGTNPTGYFVLPTLKGQVDFTLDFSSTQRYSCVVIPAFDADGKLPAGIHWAEWAEIVVRFGGSAHRQRLLSGLYRALRQFKASGCQALYLDGSFVTTARHPNDYDACYDVVKVDPRALDRDLVDFSDFRGTRVRQKAKFFGEFFPAQMREGATGKTFVDFFQVYKDTGLPKGIIALDLRSWQP